MYARMMHILIPVFVAFYGVCVGAVRVAAQSEQEETLGGPDSHETGQGPHGHLFGEWGGERMRLLERGVRVVERLISVGHEYCGCGQREEATYPGGKAATRCNCF